MTISTNCAKQAASELALENFKIRKELIGTPLMTPDEVRRLDNKNAIVFVRGERPVIDEKYDILQHPNIKLTEDGGAAPYIHHPVCIYDVIPLKKLEVNNEEEQ